MTRGLYLDRWATYEEMKADWLRGPYDYEKCEYGVQDVPFPPEESIILALYTGGSYDGTAFVLFDQDGKLYEVNGYHCSCYELNESNYSGEAETQWQPEETTVAALKMRDDYGWEGYADQVKDVIASLEGQYP